MDTQKNHFWVIGSGLLVLGCAALILYWALPDILFPLSENDKTIIEARYQEFCRVLALERYEKAYEFMSSEYRKKHTLDTYQREYKKGISHEHFTLERACDWHRVPEGKESRAALYQWKGEFFAFDVGAIVYLVKENGVWYIDSAVWSMD